jgi:hypothetical protein
MRQRVPPRALLYPLLQTRSTFVLFWRMQAPQRLSQNVIKLRSVPRFKFILARCRPSAVRCNSCRKARTLCLQATRSPRPKNQKGRIPAFRLTAGPPTYWQRPLPSPHLQQPHELLPFCHQRWVTRRLEPPFKQQFRIFFLVRLQPVVSLSDTVLIKASSRKLQPNWIQGFQHDLLRMNGKKMGA